MSNLSDNIFSIAVSFTACAFGVGVGVDADTVAATAAFASTSVGATVSLVTLAVNDTNKFNLVGLLVGGISGAVAPFVLASQIGLQNPDSLNGPAPDRTSAESGAVHAPKP